MATRRGIEPLPSDRQSGTLPLRQRAICFNLHQVFVGVNHFSQVVVSFFVGLEDLSSMLADDSHRRTKALYETKAWVSTITPKSCVPAGAATNRVVELVFDV